MIDSRNETPAATVPKPRSTRRSWRLSVFLVGLIGLIAWAPQSLHAEDRLVVRGDELRGAVVDLNDAGVVFDPVYGTGKLTIPWSDVEQLQTAEALTVLYGDKGMVQGRIVGVSGDGSSILVGTSRESASRVETASLFSALGPDVSGLDRLRSEFRYWYAAFDAGGSVVNSNTDTTSTYLALRLDREKDPLRWLLEGNFRYARQNAPGDGEGSQLVENVVFGFTRGEYDLSERVFTYLSARATYDEDQHLSLRAEPRGGLGVQLVESKEWNLAVDAGAAWIYENYFGTENGIRRGRDNYWTVAFGANADAKLPLGARWRGRVEYLPAVDDWEENYIARGETSVEFPLLEWLAFKLIATDEYDNTPAEGSVRNRFTATAALSARFP